MIKLISNKRIKKSILSTTVAVDVDVEQVVYNIVKETLKKQKNAR